MTRIAGILALLLIIAAAVGLYRFKAQAANNAAQIEQLHAEIEAERERISMLRAEWTYLNQPDRIQDLAERHLDLERMKGAQMGTIDALPMRPLDVEPFEGDAIGALAEQARVFP